MSIRKQCKALDIHRSRIYYEPKEESEENLKIMRKMDELYLMDPCLGARKYKFLLNQEGFNISRYKIGRLMKLMGIEAIYRKPRTTIPCNSHKKYPYLLRGLPINKPNQVWTSEKKKIQDINAGEWLKLLQTKILNASCGNPGIADKMIKEAHSLSFGGELELSQIQAIQEPYLERKYFDLTPLVMVGLACFAVLRFIGIGTNDTLLYIIGDSAFVIFMAFGRLLARGSYKR